MYQTKIASASGRYAVDIRGTNMYNIGNVSLKPGDYVMTDGRCIYGRHKNQGLADITDIENVIPFASIWGGIGYLDHCASTTMIIDNDFSTSKFFMFVCNKNGCYIGIYGDGSKTSNRIYDLLTGELVINIPKTQLQYNFWGGVNPDENILSYAISDDGDLYILSDLCLRKNDSIIQSFDIASERDSIDDECELLAKQYGKSSKYPYVYRATNIKSLATGRVYSDGIFWVTENYDTIYRSYYEFKHNPGGRNDVVNVSLDAHMNKRIVVENNNMYTDNITESVYASGIEVSNNTDCDFSRSLSDEIIIPIYGSAIVSKYGVYTTPGNVENELQKKDWVHSDPDPKNEMSDDDNSFLVKWETEIANKYCDTYGIYYLHIYGLSGKYASDCPLNGNFKLTDNTVYDNDNKIFNSANHWEISKNSYVLSVSNYYIACEYAGNIYSIDNGALSDITKYDVANYNFEYVEKNKLNNIVETLNNIINKSS